MADTDRRLLGPSQLLQEAARKTIKALVFLLDKVAEYGCSIFHPSHDPAQLRPCKG
jgi:hypothetical protein